MKNIFDVSEMEKERILELHNNSNDKRPLLKEQEVVPETITIGGTIVDENEEGIPGVSIVVSDDHTIGVASDLDGKFTLEGVKPTDMINISFIGRAPIELVATDESLQVGNTASIVMAEDTTVLDQVTVTSEKSEYAVNPEVKGCRDPGATNYNAEAGSDCEGNKPGEDNYTAVGEFGVTACCTYATAETIEDFNLEIIDNTTEKKEKGGWFKRLKDSIAAKRLKNVLNRTQDIGEIKILIDKIKRAQDGKVQNKAKVNLFSSKRAARKRLRSGYIGQVRINGYGAIIMNDKGNKMIGMTFPVLEKGATGKYDKQNRLTYKFYRNKLRLGQEKVVATKDFRTYLKQMEKFHKALNKELRKIPVGDFS